MDKPEGMLHARIFCFAAMRHCDEQGHDFWLAAKETQWDKQRLQRGPRVVLGRIFILTMNRLAYDSLSQILDARGFFFTATRSSAH